mmetsp:Transcript_26489/g.39186  ORF Transcript_26489/g.39186 Transcript_26489/m.39186 type:complete len:509 (+) Transcript_26489:54-1580(+)
MMILLKRQLVQNSFSSRLNVKRLCFFFRRRLSSDYSIYKGSGYQTIGSFHSENVENLMKQSSEKYVLPTLPFETMVGDDVESPPFMLDKKNWTFLNHGAFGGSLRCTYTRAEEWRRYLEAQPLRFFDRDLLPHLVYSARRLADFVKADRHGIALLPNVTTGLNAVLAGYTREYQHPKTSKILLWDISYGSVKKMARTYCKNVIEIPFQSEYACMVREGVKERESNLAIEDEDMFLTALEDTLTSVSSDNDANWENTLFLMDHTTSNTALNLPINRLSRRAKEAGMITVVDGAHGLFAQDIDFSKTLDASVIDIYISNGHKWLCCPRGVAFMYCPRKELRETILRQPAVISHGVDDGYLSRFLWDGCRDYAAQLSLPVALDYWERADPSLMRTWMNSKLVDGIRIIAEHWYPQYADDDEYWAGNVTLGSMSLHSPMALVKLPPAICGSLLRSKKTSTDAKRIQDFLYNDNIEAPIKCINGVLFVRLSCHIHNDLKEFDRLAKAVLEYSE